VGYGKVLQAQKDVHREVVPLLRPSIGQVGTGSWFAAEYRWKQQFGPGLNDQASMPGIYINEQ